MEKVPIETIHLFEPIHDLLIELLTLITPAEWNQPTIAKLWSVKDVTAHLLDTSIRYVCANRDSYRLQPNDVINDNKDLVNWLNRLNNDWVNAMKRTSPEILIEWIDTAGKLQNKLLKKIDLFEPSPFAVSWAGESSSINWFHVAREYTEQWHHQQQIRDAVGKPALLTRQYYYPVLDTFMMALPFTYRSIKANINQVVQVSVTGEGGGDWFLIKKEDKWELQKETDLPVIARTVIDGNIAWKLFTKSWRKSDVMKYVMLKGDIKLASHVLEMVAVVA